MARRWLGQCCDGDRHSRNTRLDQQRKQTARMADTAIEINAGITVLRALLRGRRLMMLVLMMTQVPGHRALLVLAIPRDRRPGSLDSDERNQQKDEELAHRQKCSSISLRPAFSGRLPP